LPAFAWTGETWLRLASIHRLILLDLRVLLFPYDLHYYRSLDILDPGGFANLIFLFLCVGMAWALRRLPDGRRRLGILGVSWFLITLLPVIGIVPLIHEYSQVALFEHFLYLPSVGFWLVVAAFLPTGWFIFSRDKKSYFRLSAWAAVFILLSLLTIKQNTFWRDEVVLFERAVRFEPRLGRAQMLLARAYYFHQAHDQAIVHYGYARDIMAGYEQKANSPTTKDFYQRFLKEIDFELAHCFESLGAWDKAAESYRRVVVLAPQDHVILNNLGVVYLRKGDVPAAKKIFVEAVSLNPVDPMAQTNLAYCLIQEGQREEAEKMLKKVLETTPSFQAAEANLKLLQAGK